jgi:hypothetical protein
VLATSALFLANRLLEGLFPSTTQAEQLVFWLAWAAGIAVAFLARPRQVAALELSLSGALLVGTVSLDLGAGGQALHDPIRAGVNAALLLLAAACLAGGARLLRRRGSSSVTTRPLAELPHWVDAE